MSYTPSLLDGMRVASPCKVSWEDMTGDDRVRFCGRCAKNVYNLSAFSREEAESLLRAGQARRAEHGDGVCVRFYRRADGTVLTADCPDGAARKKRRLAVFGALGAGLMAAGVAGCGGAVPTTGDPIMIPPPPPPADAGAQPTMGTIPQELPAPPAPR